jgi:hypothetical protein
MATIELTARVSNTAPPVPGAVTVTLVLLTLSPPLVVVVTQVPTDCTFVNATAPAWNTVLPLSVMATVLETAEGFWSAYIAMLTQLLVLALSWMEHSGVRAVPFHVMLLTVGVEAALFCTIETPTSRVLWLPLRLVRFSEMLPVVDADVTLALLVANSVTCARAALHIRARVRNSVVRRHTRRVNSYPPLRNLAFD